MFIITNLEQSNVDLNIQKEILSFQKINRKNNT